MSNEDLPLFAYKPRREAQVARDEALEKVEKNAGEEWNIRARSAMLEYLSTHETFFVDDFWDATSLESPREPRAMGAVINNAAREGLMVKTGEYRQLRRRIAHARPSPVWRSLIYGTKP